MSCEEAVRQFFAYLDRALAGEAAEDLERHLSECMSCCEKLDFSRKLDGLVKARLLNASLPDGVEQRLRRVLEAAGRR